jgi:DNA modification methylase
MTTDPPRIAWEDSHGRLWQGDVRACLAAMEPESVQTCITSPPYWGLRSYSTEPQIWGGDPSCSHQLEDSPGLPPMTGGSGTASAKQVTNAGSQFGNAWAIEHPAGYRSSDTNPGPLQHQGNTGRENRSSASCTRCGAWRGELGAEGLHDCAGWATGAPCGQCFICHLVEVFAAVKRVLRPDGVCLVNLGDSYAAGKTGRAEGGDPTSGLNHGKGTTNGQKWDTADFQQRKPPPGLKAKDLVGIPWRFALAMQAAGWWLRGDYIWSKPNPMPESVTDRCTRSHEYVFHFSKAATYYWDAEAIKETSLNAGKVIKASGDGAQNGQSRGVGDAPNGAMRTAWGFTQHDTTVAAGRNARSVWEIATHAYPEAHFATFPPEIPRRAIRAGTSERGACAATITKLRPRRDLTPEQQARLEAFLRRKGRL